MRLDKYACETTDLTRAVAKKAVKRGDFTVDGIEIRDPAFKVPQGAEVQYCGRTVAPVGLRYIMMHKPVDTICTTSDTEIYQSVISLMDIEKPERLHIAGRLDADTTGLILITDDGQWSHKITTPKNECFKVYQAELADPVSVYQQADLIEQFKQGLMLNGEDKPTKPAVLEFIEEDFAQLSICEGRYHQVKRMFAAVGNQVVGLHRMQIGDIKMDDDLEPCEWRYLSDAEVASVMSNN
ncbi:pseudouridine synthase [Catenovulum sediminis]|uniref:Pseudouridine synthase n=1 Tax=Catenovulum sediminis TaxID=1740262 RepID=A0ABV1RHK3_9ALTE|nr:pseudouridine synthase [Catenovulum sediminis]